MSIFKKLTILFVFSLILMTIIGSWTDNINKKRVENLVKEKYTKIIEEIVKNIENQTIIEKIIKENDLKKSMITKL